MRPRIRVARGKPPGPGGRERAGPLPSMMTNPWTSVAFRSLAGHAASQLDGLLEGRPVLQREVRHRDRRRDREAVHVEAEGLRVRLAVARMPVEVLAAHAERVEERPAKRLAATPLRAAAAVGARPAPPNPRAAEELPKVLVHVSPPARIEVGRRRGVPADPVVAGGKQGREAAHAVAPERRAELG